MGPEVRTIEPSEFPGFVACLGAGFFQPIADGYAEYFLGQVDLDRTRAAFDSHQVVGTLRSFATELTVPGAAQVAAAALTSVTVAPSHRRRGLLTEMITADLRDAHERGEKVGILIAAEFPIYARYGYGVAIEGAKYTVNTAKVRWLDPAVGTVERVALAVLRKEAPVLYDRFRSVQPGSIERPTHW